MSKPKSSFIIVRVTPAEKKLLERRVWRSGQTLTAYIREKLKLPLH